MIEITRKEQRSVKHILRLKLNLDYLKSNMMICSTLRKVNGEYGSKYEVRGRVLTLLHRKHSEESRDDDDYYGEKGADDILF